MKHILLSIFMIAFLISCKKDSLPNKRNFEKGEVLVGIKPAVQLSQLFVYINADNLIIDQIQGYSYTTTIAKDSIPYIIEVLNTKAYIKTRGFSAAVWPHYETQVVHNTSSLWDMTVANQQDYISTLHLLRMADGFSTGKYMLLKVPVGKENYWRERFKSLNWVSWSELNWIGEIVPFNG